MARRYLVLALGVVSVSFAAIFIRLAEAPVLVIAAYRLILASLLITPIACARAKNELLGLMKAGITLPLLSGLLLALHFVLWIASLSRTTVASSVVLVTANPVFVALASYFLFREKLSRQVFIGIAVCLAGAALVSYGDWTLGFKPLLGDMLALAGAIAVAGYFLIGRRLRQTTGVLSYAAIVYGSAALVLLFSVFVFQYPLLGYSTTTYIMLVLLALIPQTIGHLSLTWSLRFVSATLVTVAVLGEPIGATVLAFIILNEAPTLTQVLGGALILTGIFLAFRKRIPQAK
jgi:drug/metabolite transporter (DMT)-like permease